MNEETERFKLEGEYYKKASDYRDTLDWLSAQTTRFMNQHAADEAHL